MAKLLLIVSVWALVLTFALSKVVVVPFEVPACNGIPPGDEACFYRLVYNDFSCTAKKPCSKLLAYFGGGEESVKDGVYDQLMKYWTRQGYLTVVAQTFNTSDESALYPYFEEYDRMGYIIDQARTAYADLWTGDYLAIGGVSHGASAPPAAIANADAFHTNAATWTGKKQTAMVLFDGISNPALYDDWLGQFSLLNGTTCWGEHSRTVNRYAGQYPLEHSCKNHKCYCSDPENTAGWENDTVVITSTYPPSPYSCQQFNQPTGAEILWYFASCEGELLKPCNPFGDFVPDEQQADFYDSIANCTGLTAKYDVYPICGHSVCGTQFCGASDAAAWLNSYWGE